MKYLSSLVLLFSMGICTSSFAISPSELFPEGLNGMAIKGEYVRKGTVGSLIANVAILDKLQEKAEYNPTHYQEAIQDIKAVLAGLKALEMFNIFPIESWLSATLSNGQPRYSKQIVGILALNAFEDLRTPENMQLKKETESRLPQSVRGVLQ